MRGASLPVAGGLGRLGRDRLDHRLHPDALQVGQEVVVEGQLIAGPVPRDDPDLAVPAEQPGAMAPLHHRLQNGRVVRPRPPQVGRALLGPVGNGGPLTDERRMPLLRDAELVVARPVTDAVQDGERSRAALGPVLAERAHVGLAGRIEGADDRIDLASVDAARRVDLTHEERDGLGLLGVLDIAGEAVDAGQRLQIHHGEDDVDGALGHASRTGAGPVHRCGPAGRGGERDGQRTGHHQGPDHPASPPPHYRPLLSHAVPRRPRTVALAPPPEALHRAWGPRCCRDGHAGPAPPVG